MLVITSITRRGTVAQWKIGPIQKMETVDVFKFWLSMLIWFY